MERRDRFGGVLPYGSLSKKPFDVVRRGEDMRDTLVRRTWEYDPARYAPARYAPPWTLQAGSQ